MLFDHIKDWTGYLAVGIEAGAAIIIGLAAIEAIARSLLLFVHPGAPPQLKTEVRLRLGRWLSIALELELAADILRTAIAPSWDEIGKLAAIATIRTALNWFLQRDVEMAARQEGDVPA